MSEAVRQAGGVPPRNLDRLSRVYGPTTWDVYERLDVSLEPNGPDWLYELAGQYLQPGDVVLDAGCRDAEHLIRLVEANQVTGVGVDPVEIHIERGRLAVDAAGLADRVVLHLGVMHDLPYDDGYFDFVWCRDVLEQVDDLDGALSELVRLMGPSARLLVYTTFATELLDGRDAEMLRRHLGNVVGNLDAGYVEAAFRRADLAVERKDVIGTEWREYAEERTKPASRALLRLSRLRRQRDDIIDGHGRDIYDHIEANLHWEIFQLLGKLVPVVYILTQASAAA
jgi:ubiquinone/menaquinone biosynthesis C-methylase UbiE